METNEFTSVDEILFNILTEVGDEEMKSGFAKGWYIQKIKDALSELAFDTHFDTQSKDYNVPSNLQLEMPKDCFNVRKIYLYNGDCCTPQTSAIVHWKKNFNNNKSGSGYTANRVDSGQRTTNDPYYPSHPVADYTGGSVETVYYANIQNGKIMLSSNCLSFSKIRLEFDGVGGFSDELPIVPRLFKSAIEYFVVERVFAAKKAREPRLWRASHSDSLSLKQQEWEKARLRAKRMHSWEKDNIREYWGRFNY